MRNRLGVVCKISASVFGLLIVSLMLFPLVVSAQQTQGVILGVVKDAASAVVPDARVTIQNADTNESRSATSGPDGAYRFPDLQPGRYTITIQKEGFRTAIQTGLTLDVAQQLVVNPIMEVGSTTQELTVTTEAPVVNTTTSTLGGLVNDRQIADLPLNGRNFIDLTLLQPGIQQNSHPAGGGAGASGTWYSSNGEPPRSNNFILDGAIMQNQYGTGPNSIAATTLGVDGIKEYRVITDMFGAEYGLTMGSQMVILSKGGTNGWHGDAFEYLRNSHMDARNFFDYGYLTPGAPRLPEFQRNNFGGSVGGPIQKNKTFFYLVYEGLRSRTGATILDSVMPAACHNLVPVGSGGTTAGMVVDLAQQNAVLPNGANLANPGACNSALAPQNNGGMNVVIPAVMQPWIGQFPLPNLPGTSNNYTYPAKSATREDYSQLRVDHNFSTNDNMFARYTFDDDYLHTPFPNITQLTGGTAMPQYDTIGRSRNQYTTVGEDHIFSPEMLNSFRLSFSRTNFRVVPESEISALNPFGPLVGPQWSLVPGGLSSFGPAGGLTSITFLGTAPAYHVQNLWTLDDDVFYTKGKHAFKFGTLMNNFQEPNLISKGLNGSITFSNLASFMQGEPNGGQVISALPQYTSPGTNILLPPFNGNAADRDFMWKTFGFYGQDDWRATSRLTVNLGLRYEFMTKVHELYGREVVLLDIQQSSTPTTGLQVSDPSYGNWSPRIGLAYDVFGNGKTALRGGFGLYYDVGNIGAMLTQVPTGFPPFSQQTNASFPTGTVLTLPVDYSAGGTLGRNLQGNAYNVQQPRTMQYNLTIDQQLPLGMGLSVSYVGARGYNLWTGIEGNPTQPAGYNNGVPFYNVTTGEANCYSSALIPGVTQTFKPNAAPCRINPYWGSFEEYTTQGNSWYNSLQVLVTKRLGHGLSFQGAYTFAKSLDTTQGQMFGDDCNTSAIGQYPSNLGLDKAVSCFDVPNALHMNLIYHVPDMVKSHNILSKFTNGWWTSSIVTVQQGQFTTPIIGSGPERSFAGIITQSNQDYASLNTAAATTVCAAGGQLCTKPGGTITYNWIPFNKNTVVTGNPSNWYNPLMFGEAPLGQLGDSGRNILPLPGLGEWDFSLVKDTAVRWLGEQGMVEFRAEIFNIINRANFGPPTSNDVFTDTTDISTANGGNVQSPVGSSAANPLGTAFQISTTANNSRQIQLALKVLF